MAPAVCFTLDVKTCAGVAYCLSQDCFLNKVQHMHDPCKRRFVVLPSHMLEMHTSQGLDQWNAEMTEIGVHFCLDCICLVFKSDYWRLAILNLKQGVNSPHLVTLCRAHAGALLTLCGVRQAKSRFTIRALLRSKFRSA